jgi:hypothetical protein
MFLSLSFAFHAGAQHHTDSIRSLAIRRYPDHFFVWPVIKRRSLTFSVENGSVRNQTLNFRPNNAFSAGVGIYAFDIAAEISAAIPLDELSTSRYGTSSTRDFSGILQGKNWGIDGFIQKYSGFYLNNPSPNVPLGQPYPLRPDIRLNSTGASGIYVFNKRSFSLWSAYNYSERQLKSHGSWLLAGTVSTVRLAGDSVILSPADQVRLQTNNNFRTIRYATFSMAPGYSYSLIYRQFYLNLSVSVGPAHHWVHYLGPDNREHYDIAINSFADTRVAVGYNSDRWFGGITFVNKARTVRFDNFILDSQSTSFRMLVGYRIQEFGVLKKTWKDFFPAHLHKYL